MLQTAIKKIEGNTTELTVTIPWSRAKDEYAKLLDQTISEIQVEGFRKGKAPRELAEKQVNTARVLEETLKKIIPDIYAELVKENDLKPIASPKVELIEAEVEKDWRVRFTVAGIPVVTLGDYKKKLEELKAKKPQIWVPGKSEEKKEQKASIDLMLETLMTAVTVEVSPILIEEETNRLLSEMFDELKKLGLTVDQYLQAQGKNADALRTEYTDRAKKSLALQFALAEIAEKEKIIVEPTEVDTVINQAKTDAEKENLRKQQYYISSLLRRQKTLDHLMKLAGVERESEKPSEK